MGLVFLPTWKPYKSTIHVGEYTSPMDGMGNDPCIFTQHHQETLEANIAFEDEEGLEATPGTPLCWVGEACFFMETMAIYWIHMVLPKVLSLFGKDVNGLLMVLAM